jgi:hypothetical protein
MLNNTEITNKGGRPMNTEAVKLVKTLKDDNNLSFREILEVMQKRLRRKLDIKTIYRWYHYRLPAVDKTRG